MADYRTVERPSEYNQVAEQRDRERAIAKVKKEQAGLEAAAERYERYKLTLAVSARSSDVLGDRLDAARALKTVNPKVIEHDPAA